MPEQTVNRNQEGEPILSNALVRAHYNDQVCLYDSVNHRVYWGTMDGIEVWESIATVKRSKDS